MRVSPTIWCLIVLIHTPNQTVLVSSWNLMNLISTTQSKAQTGPSIFSQMDAPQILQFLRRSLNAACSSSVPCSTTAIIAPCRLDATLNLTVTQVGMLQGKDVAHVSSAQIRLLCTGMNPLNPYIVLDIKNVAASMRLVHAPEIAPQLQSISLWLESGDPLDQSGISEISCFIMSITSIISIINGLSTLPICVSRNFVDTALLSNGACPLIIGAVAPEEKRNVLINHTRCPYGPDHLFIPCQFPFADSITQASSSLAPGYPKWMFQMTYMVKFGQDVRSGWGKLPKAFELVHRRILRSNTETPPWAVQMLKGKK